jgi:SAM-dependent methyltransferase
MTPSPLSTARELAGLPPREAARRVAGGVYRRVGALGAKVLGAPAAEEGPSYELPDPASPPWAHRPGPPPTSLTAVQCPVCGWWGDAFEGPAHVELSLCPGCGANGRDRFLHWCLQRRVPLGPALRVIECSPRLGEAYRSAMATWFFYRTSDFDERAHRGNLRLDLQAIDLPDASLDVLLCAHVVEHVPDTDKALAELRRVMAPGGHLLLQVPVLQGRTAPPATPEFHGDHTPVYWRFGFDLTARLREAGFRADLLCTEGFAYAVKVSQSGGLNPWTQWSGEFDVPSILSGAIPDDLVVVADRTESARAGIDPGYMYLTWDCTPT